MSHEQLILFNSSHDSFHLNKWYNLMCMMSNRKEKISREELFELEKVYYLNNACLKPKSCIDIYILLRRHSLQFTMASFKEKFTIQNVPKQAVPKLLKECEEFGKTLSPLLFAKSKNKERWKVDYKGQFADIYLSFQPSAALKAVVRELLGKDTQTIEIPQEYMPPDEKAKGKSSKEYRPYNYTWPKLIDYHLDYWKTEQGKLYAREDIEHLIDLEVHIKASDQLCACGKEIYSGQFCSNCNYQNPVRWPKTIDIDSDLAWMVGQVRANGFALDNKLLNDTISKSKDKRSNIPTAPAQAKRYMMESDDWVPELGMVVKGTDAQTLDIIINGEFGDVSDRAKQIKTEREINKQIDLLEKLQEVGRAHPDFAASGTKSNRMAGRGGLNYQGINRDSIFRKIFTMVDEGYKLSGGDFEGQEVSILSAVCNDPALHSDLETYKSIHLLMWRVVYNEPDATLEYVKSPENKEPYTKCKNGVFAWSYGAEDPKFAETLSITIEEAKRIREQWFKKYPGFKDYKDSIVKDFASMTQPGGLGTNVVWKDPKEYVESMLGYRRYYNLENGIAKFFFKLANNLPVMVPCQYCNPQGKPKRKRDYSVGCNRCSYQGNHDNDLIYRRDYPQKVRGACQSALYGAAFRVQAGNLRSAGNHVIQSTGGEITKRVQHAIWSLQPEGISDFRVKPMNVHDEVIVVNNCPGDVSDKVHKTVKDLKELVPLLAIDWKEDIPDWSGK